MASLGYGSGKATVDSEFGEVTGDATGTFAIGLFYDSELSDNFDLLPSIAFGIGEKVEDESNNSLAIGLGLQFYPTGKDGKFFIQPGLGLGFSLAEDVEGINSSTLSGSIGLGIDLSDNLLLWLLTELRYLIHQILKELVLEQILLEHLCFINFNFYKI